MNNTNNMKDNLKQALVEWHEFKIPPISLRGYGRKALENKRLLSIIGPRRAGKTFVCFEIITDLITSGIPRENIIYMNFEDERLVPLSGAELTNLLDVHAQVFTTNPERPFYCFLDEIQNVPSWSKWVRRITDLRPEITVVVTGSSSKMLSTEIASELRGRGSSITIFPYSFKEYLNANNYNIDVSEKLLYSSEKNILQKYCNEFYTQGGFPAVVGRTEYREMLQEYYRAMFTRDIMERFTIKNVRQFEDFLKIIITRFSSLVSISNIENVMREFGYSMSKNTLQTYLGYAKDVFLLFDICKFDSKITNQLRAPRKIYAVDNGLLNAIRFSTSEDRGRILENVVFMELRRRYDTIFYHHDKTECDFVVMVNNKVVSCFQVCWSIENRETMDREIRGLVNALKTYNVDIGYILTDAESADLDVEGKKIIVRPFWFFALQPA
jgi:predicted AAA+ superfamily ATPase